MCHKMQCRDCTCSQKQVWEKLKRYEDIIDIDLLIEQSISQVSFEDFKKLYLELKQHEYSISFKQYSLLTQRYPFLIIEALSTDEECDACLFDFIPKGWRENFGLELCEELREELLRQNFLKQYHVIDIKEKYGELRITDCGAPSIEKIDCIKDKYREFSKKTCIKCGKPMTHFNSGWVMPLCNDCDD